MKILTFYPAVFAWSAAALLGAASFTAAPTTARAADLVVDTANNNSPFPIANGNFLVDNVYVGQTTTGTLNQSGGALTATASGGQLYLGFNAGSIGTYNLSGGTLNTPSSDVGDYGRGTFNLSGNGVHNVTGGANGSLDIGYYQGSVGTYNLNGGTLITGYVRGNQGTSIFNFNGGALTAAANATDFFQNLTRANVQSLGAKIDTAGYNVTVAQSLVSGTASGTADGGLAKYSAGTLTLTGNNSYTGGTTLVGGTLNVGSSGALGSSSTISFAGGTLQYSAANQTDYTSRFSTAANQPYRIDTNGQTVNFAGNLTSSGGTLTKLGSGTLTLSGANTYTSDTTVNAGTLAVSGSLQSGTNNALTVDGQVASPAVLSLSGTGNVSVGAANIGFGGAGVVTQTGGTFSSGGSGVTFGYYGGSSGTYNLSGTGTYSAAQTYLGFSGAGMVTQTGGTFNNDTQLYLGLQADSSGTYNLSGTGSLNTGSAYIGYSGTGTVTQIGGTFSTYNNSNNVYGVLSVASGTTSVGTYNLGGGTLSTGKVYVSQSGQGSFVQTGGTFSTNGNSLNLGFYAGGTGTYSLIGMGSLNTGEVYVGYSGTGTFTQTRGNLNTAGSALYAGYDTSGTGTYNLGGGTLTVGTVYVGYNGTGTFTQTNGNLSAVGNPLYVGYNSGSNGTYNLDGGTLAVGTVGGGGGSAGGTSTFNLAGGTLQATASTTTFFQNLNTANVQTGGAKVDTQNFNVTIAQNLLHDTTTGAAAADGGLTKIGAGTLTLTGRNTYTGPTTISAGTLSVASDLNLGATGSVVNVLAGGSLVFTGNAPTTARTFNLAGGTLAPASGGTLSYVGANVNGGILGAGNQVLASQTTLNGTRTVSGTVLSQSGTVSWNSVILGGNSTFTQALGATLNSTGDFVTTPNSTMTVNGTFNAAGGSISGGLTINNGGTVNATGGSSTPLYLDGSRGTTVNASGKLNAASGSTVELGGLLVNNGVQTGTLNVNLGGVARGTGSFGTVNVNQGGYFGPNALSTGSGVGTSGLAVFHLGGPGGLAQTAFVGPQLRAMPAAANVLSLALGSGSVFAFNVQDAQGAAGSGYDTVSVAGTLNLSAGTAMGSRITITVTSLGADGTSGQASNFDPSKNYSFTLATAAGGITGFDPAEFVVNTASFQNSTQGGSFSVVQQGNNLNLVFTSAVPEPGTWAWLILGAGGLSLIAQRQSRHRES